MTLDFNNSPAVSNTKISVMIIAVLCLILLFASKLLLANTLHTAQLSTSLYSHTINFDQVEFNLLTRSVSNRPNPGSSQRTAKLQANSFSIKHWQQQYLPLLDDLPVKVNGKSLTISINDDETQFFIATDKEQALLSSKGDIIWRHEIKEFASEAVISYDQQYIIVRYNNDIVRWYDYQSGDRLFSLFIQPESLQWIIWSANGYYDSSDPDFEPVTFEHNNTGSTSLSQLRHYLFRPDIIQKAVAGDRTALLAAIKLPKDTTAPSISSLNDIDDSNEKLFFCIKNSSSGPVRVIFAMNDVTIQRKTISTT
ncbi:MAG: hypothetical protein KAQ67_11770, partial [Gammaproteobacteria bacterium]|nr:hypothetical protein [Gammaproteobacteria bacterium]